MAGDRLPIERLRDYLRELKPEARAMLVGELERGLLAAEEVPGTDLVLRELRRSLRHAGDDPARTDAAARLFFRPFEPFLVDDTLEYPHRSRIARGCLERLWIWLKRDVLPAEATAFADEVNVALRTNDAVAADALTRAFQDRAAGAFADVLARARGDEKAMRRLSAQVATRRAITDIECAAIILGNRDAFDIVNARLPQRIKTLADAEVSEIRTLFESPMLPHADLLPYGLVLVMNRMAAPWQLVRFAVRAADSDVAGRVAATPYGVAVDIALDELERMVGELRAELNSGQGIAVIALLKAIHDAARGLRTEIDLSAESAWSRQLASIRTEVAHLVRASVESMPGRVRRLLRPRAAMDVAPGQVLDLQDVLETDMLIGFVGACRHFAGELGLSEMTLRAFTEVQHNLDGARQAVLDGLRYANDRDRAYRRSQVDAAIRFGTTVFGRDYAVVLARAAGLAAAAERKAITA